MNWQYDLKKCHNDKIILHITMNTNFSFEYGALQKEILSMYYILLIISTDENKHYTLLTPANHHYYVSDKCHRYQD